MTENPETTAERVHALCRKYHEAADRTDGFTVVPRDALTRACADLDAARERIADLESQLNAIAARAHK